MIYVNDFLIPWSKMKLRIFFQVKGEQNVVVKRARWGVSSLIHFLRWRFIPPLILNTIRTCTWIKTWWGGLNLTKETIAYIFIEFNYFFKEYAGDGERQSRLITLWKAVFNGSNESFQTGNLRLKVTWESRWIPFYWQKAQLVAAMARIPNILVSLSKGNTISSEI